MEICDTKKDTLPSHTNCKRKIKWKFEIKVAIYDYQNDLPEFFGICNASILGTNKHGR